MDETFGVPCIVVGVDGSEHSKRALRWAAHLWSRFGAVMAAVQGYPAKVLAERSSGALVLVVGSRGHAGPTAGLLGSASSACSKNAQCPVRVVHDSEPSAADAERASVVGASA